MKRLGILNLYDREGILDNCQRYLIEHLMRVTDRLVIVCNQKLDMETWENCKQVPRILYYKESDNQLQSIKFALLENHFMEILCDFDELIITNDSFFGPIYPFCGILEEMEKRPCDFWSMIKIGERLPKGQYAIEEHLDLNFLLIKRCVFQNQSFLDYWKQADLAVTNGEEAEVDFFHYFTNAGFISETYIDSSFYTSKQAEDNFDPTLIMEYELIRYQKYPFLKKECFVWSEFSSKLGFGDGLAKAMSYIKDYTDYPVEAIWKYVLRCYNIVDIYESMQLNYVLPLHAQQKAKWKHEKKVAVILHLYYEELLEKSFQYIAEIPKEITVIVTSSNPRIREACKNYFDCLERKNHKIISVENRGRDAAALLVGCRQIFTDYQYLCFVHDKKTSGSGTFTIGQTFMGRIFENLLKSKEYIENILELFESNPLLGLLSPPIPFHSFYFKVFAYPWTVCFGEAKKLAERLQFQQQLRFDKPPFALSTCFWCRTEALKKIFSLDLLYEDFPEEPMKLDGEINHAIERILIYVAQEAGYFSGTVENAEYASTEILNLNYELRTIVTHIAEMPVFNDRDSLLNILMGNTVQEFCLQYENIYIYGAGEMADAVADTLEKDNITYIGFIVSDGQTVPKRKREHKVCYWSEIRLADKDGIILALNRRNEAQVLPVLQKSGIERGKIYTF